MTEHEDELENRNGWIALSRDLLFEGWLVNHKRTILWIYLLLRASFKRRKILVEVKRNSSLKTIEVELEAGQLIFGRIKAAQATGLSEQEVRTLIEQFVDQGHILKTPTTNYSIITIVNWSKYQSSRETSNRNSPTLNHDTTIYNNEKNEKGAAEENLIDIPFHNFTKQLSQYLFEKGLPIKEEELYKKLRKAYFRYGLETLENVFAEVLARIDKGDAITSPIGLALTILKDEDQ